MSTQSNSLSEDYLSKSFIDPKHTESMHSIGPPLESSAASDADSPATIQDLCLSKNVDEVFVLGCGSVARSLLRLLPTSTTRIVGVCDRSAVYYSRKLFDTHAVVGHKSSGQSLSSLKGAATVPLKVLLSIFPADQWVDCSSTDLSEAAAALNRSLKIVKSKKRLVFAAKHSLYEAPHFFAELNPNQYGINAVLGGTGLALQQQLPLLQASCTEFAFVGNATTTLLIEAIERGQDLEAGLEQARAIGLVEANPTQDLSGVDAAIKLCIVAGLVFGRSIRIEDIECPEFGTLDNDLIRKRKQLGLTTRLVARCKADSVSLAYEELPLASTLATDHSHVAYTYGNNLNQTRVHLGRGLGADGTARAILEDLCSVEGGVR